MDVCVTARCDRLRLHRRGVTSVPGADLEGNDSTQVVVHAHAVHNRDASVVLEKHQLAAIVFAVEGDERASAGAGDEAPALPHVRDTVRTDPAHSPRRPLDAPRLARRHAGNEAIPVSGVELPIAARRQHRRAVRYECDPQRTIARVERGVRCGACDAPAARRHDSPSACRTDQYRRSDGDLPNGQPPHDAALRMASSSRSRATVTSSTECAADMNAASYGDGARYTPRSSAA